MWLDHTMIKIINYAHLQLARAGNVEEKSDTAEHMPYDPLNIKFKLPVVRHLGVVQGPGEG